MYRTAILFLAMFSSGCDDPDADRDTARGPADTDRDTAPPAIVWRELDDACDGAPGAETYWWDEDPAGVAVVQAWCCVDADATGCREPADVRSYRPVQGDRGFSFDCAGRGGFVRLRWSAL